MTVRTCTKCVHIQNRFPGKNVHRPTAMIKDRAYKMTVSIHAFARTTSQDHVVRKTLDKHVLVHNVLEVVGHNITGVDI